VQKLRLILRIVNGLLIGLLTILVVWLGANQVLDGGFSVGLLFAFLSYKDQFLDRVSELTNKAVELRMLNLHAERLADIALTQPEPSTSHHLRRPANLKSVAVEVRRLGFRYSESEPWILRDLSFTIQAGESVAIAGPSGCGKSTLLKLLAGLLQPTEGEILVNNEPLRRLGFDNFRDLIGVVMQDDQLFAGSIADNISFFDHSPDHDLIQECAELAAVHDDIMKMPMGYGTLIGDMGTVLSGGQKQRILLARALYRVPAAVFLDEATSHLDVERERLVNTHLSNLSMTRVAIAHRKETIEAADRVIYLEGGKVAEGHYNKKPTELQTSSAS
jgi:ATP-binding cassette subfamily B protein RaxB